MRASRVSERESSYVKVCREKHGDWYVVETPCWHRVLGAEDAVEIVGVPAREEREVSERERERVAGVTLSLLPVVANKSKDEYP